MDTNKEDTVPSSLRTVCDAYWLATQPDGYPLGDWLRDQRDNGASWRQMASELRDRTDGAIDLPAATLINWMEADAEQPAA